MKYIDERHKVANVAEAWKAQYWRGDRWGRTIHNDAGVIYEQLRALPADAISKDIAAIIGNDSWAGPGRCNECKQSVLAAVEMGDEPDYDSATVRICLPCLRKAVDLAEGGEVSGFGDAR